MRKEIVYYRVRVEGVDIPSSFIVNRACYEFYHDAVEYIENGWNDFTKDHFLNRCGRKIINEFINENEFGYRHQFAIVSETGFACVVMLAVDKVKLILR